jgi:hypothetical protein
VHIRYRRRARESLIFLRIPSYIFTDGTKAGAARLDGLGFRAGVLGHIGGDGLGTLGRKLVGKDSFLVGEILLDEGLVRRCRRASRYEVQLILGRKDTVTYTRLHLLEIAVKFGAYYCIGGNVCRRCNRDRS